MAQQQTPFLLPPGRIVWGDLHKARTTDFEGRPLVYKSGPDAGKPRSSIDFGVAIPKVPGQHWASSEWGAKIWQAGHAGVSNAGQLPDFAWKIVDGDDARVPPLKPNKPQGKAPNQRPGYPGHWVLSLSSSFAPQIVDGTQGDRFPAITQVGAVVCGDIVQVRGNVQYNNSTGNPGVFLNHEVVCFSGYHPDGRIASGGVDVASVGFQTGLVAGAQAAPAGAAAVPGAVAPPAVAAPPTVVAPPAAYVAPAPVAAPPVAVAPNPNFAPPPPVVAAPPVATPARVMLPAAGGLTYEAFIAAGWTDQQLIQAGKMAA